MAKPSWISVSPTSGTNNGSFDVTANDNYINPAREGAVTVTGGGINKTIDVSQKSNRLILQRVRQQGQVYPPTKVIDTRGGKEYNLTSSNQYSAEINTDFGAIIEMTYPGIGTGGTDFLFQFNIDIDEIKLEMNDGSDRSPHIGGTIITTDSKRVLLNLGNGYPEISNTKLILSIKAGTQTMYIYYTNR
ncbi:hypothetical protein [uncultured phage cr25_1]|uniref:BACON domain-containing protein n=1 Tax=uncultured phage cr25_1 TaxID=2986395 RepID=A0AAE7V4V7_9CAUD|nr:hypothetical protein M1M55_gp29 [uncultured phage cr25_1]QWM90236.1 hypothetical protein [uncultured phage cr25_1]